MSAPTTPTASDVVSAAMSVARDAAEGRLDPAALAASCADAARSAVGRVVGKDDVLWPVQLSVTRAVLAAGGIPADELAEWLAVARGTEGDPRAGDAG